MIYVQYVIDAIGIGALFALVALGIGLIFGVMRLINLAQGELLMVGGYVLFETRAWPVGLSVAFTIAVVVLTSVLMERVAFRPLRNAAPATMLVMTFAVSFVLRSAAEQRYSSQGNAVTIFPALNDAFTFGDIRIRWVTIAAICMGAVLLTATTVFLNRTGVGLQMRAAASDFRTARTLGVRADRVIVAAFAISGFLAAAALLMFVVQRPVITPEYGLQIGVFALVGVVVGGMDRLVPATLGGFFVGFANSMLGSTLPSAQRVFLDSALYALVILVLLIRPAGLFERNVRAARV